MDYNPQSFLYEKFFHAARTGDVELLKRVLANGININAVDSDDSRGDGALHIAIRCRKSEAIKFLLENSADVDLRNAETRTPLHEAARCANPEAIEILVTYGADVNHSGGDFDFIALNHVFDINNIRTVTPELVRSAELLLDLGSRVNHDCDGLGCTAVSLIMLVCILSQPLNAFRSIKLPG